MAARWFYKTPEGEAGPVTFREMVELVRAGKLHEDDRVRGEMSSQWIAARDVVGLFYTAAAQAAQATAEASPPAAEPAQAGGEVPGTDVPPRDGARFPPSRAAAAAGLPPASAAARWRRFLGRPWATVYGMAAVVLAALVAFWWSTRTATFPPPRLGKGSGTRPPIEAMRAPRPARPTLPSLPERAPQLVPGLERWSPAFSPCLTPDLRTIVFSAMGNPKTGYDLYLATRPDVEHPFEAPRLIQSCVSPQTDAYPALSPDGLELIFARSDWKPQFLRATRRSLQEDFGPPSVWTPVDYDPERKERLERPQWLDRQRVMFCFVDLAADTRRMLVAERSRDQGPLDKIGPMPFSNPWPLYFVAASGLRAYHGTADGIFLAVRSKVGDMFGEGEMLLPSPLTGPIDGPLWVAPQEDVIIYCSPGPGKEPGSGRRLWMIRY